jgi:hypothetical protein
LGLGSRSPDDDTFAHVVWWESEFPADIAEHVLAADILPARNPPELLEEQPGEMIAGISLEQDQVTGAQFTL